VLEAVGGKIRISQLLGIIVSMVSRVMNATIDIRAYQFYFYKWYQSHART